LVYHCVGVPDKQGRDRGLEIFLMVSARLGGLPIERMLFPFLLNVSRRILTLSDDDFFCRISLGSTLRKNCTTSSSPSWSEHDPTSSLLRSKRIFSDERNDRNVGMSMGCVMPSNGFFPPVVVVVVVVALEPKCWESPSDGFSVRLESESLRLPRFLEWSTNLRCRMERDGEDLFCILA